MDKQVLRIGIAGLLSFTCVVAVAGLAVLGQTIPTLLEWVTIGSITFLFGVTSNGSGIPKPPGKDEAP